MGAALSTFWRWWALVALLLGFRIHPNASSMAVLSLLRHDRLHLVRAKKLTIYKPVTVLHGKDRYDLVLQPEATLKHLKAAVASRTGIRKDEQSLVAKGKKLTDDTRIIDLDKVMLIKKAPSPNAKSKKVKLTVRCIRSGRIANDVAVPPNIKIATLLEIARKTLGLDAADGPLGGPICLFERNGKQCLRSDLSLSDYNLAGSELFVCPDVTKKASRAPSGATSSSSAASIPLLSAGGKPPDLDALKKMMRDALPPEESAVFDAMASARPAELESSMQAVQASLNEAVQKSFAQMGIEMPAGADSGIRVEFVPHASAGAAPAAAAATTSTAATTATASSNAPAPAAASTAAAVPERLASGLLPSANAMARGGPLGMRPMMLPLPPSLVERAAGGKGGGGGDDDAKVKALEAECKQLEKQLEEQLKGNATAAQLSMEERLEKACAKAADALQPVVPTSEQKRVAKKEAKEWGKGLKGGFFSAKPKKRKPAAAAANKTEAAAEAAPAKDVAAVAAMACAPCDKENQQQPALVKEEPPAPKKKKGECCAVCDMRLPMTARLHATCKCGKLFCGRHMQCHECTFDYRAAAQRKLQEELPKLESVKL